MSVLSQILLGSVILVICTLIHIAMQVWLSRRLRSDVNHTGVATSKIAFMLCSGVVFALLASHTIQLYIWALALWMLGALPWYEEPIYFALVTYTSVGYGDVTLGENFRIFGAMAGVNGILAFGLTTAYLVNYFPRVIRELGN